MRPRLDRCANLDFGYMYKLQCGFLLVLREAMIFEMDSFLVAVAGLPIMGE